MTDPLLASYEEIPYESTPRPVTHPDVMATVATLLGMNPAPLQRCRVLELGCSTGGNLLPMAMCLPESIFVGIDLSPGHIAAGRKVVQNLGVRNLDLQPISILDFDGSSGPFDYIICHGVYSWVPETVQARILSICREHLSPQGVAFISYNTYPGWHLRGMIREMLAYHVAQFDGRVKKIQQARAFMRMLAETFKGGDNPYGRVVEEESELLDSADDSYVYHEHLEEENHPVYFHQFARRCAEAGLQYLAEARPSITSCGVLPPVLQERLSQLGLDLVRREQYLDFMRNRTFRRSILCHSEVKLDRSPDPRILERLHCSAVARPASPEADSTNDEPEEFNAPEGPRITTNNPVVKTALHVIHDLRPRRISFSGLVATVHQRAPRGDVSAIAPAMMQCYLSSLVDLHVSPSAFILNISERPRAFDLARYEAAQKRTRLSTLRHDARVVDDWDRTVVSLLDGTRDREALCLELEQRLRNGEVAIENLDQFTDTPEHLRQAVQQSLEVSLDRIAHGGLLVA